MSYLRKIIAWFLVFAILTFSVCLPAFAAADPPPTDSRGNFYDWVINADKNPNRPGGSFQGNRPWGSIGGGRPKYDEWVSTLPAPGYSSAGELRWRLNVNSFEDKFNAKVLHSSVGASWFLALASFNLDISNGYIAEAKGIFDGFTAPIAGAYHPELYHVGLIEASIPGDTNCFRIVPVKSNKYISGTSGSFSSYVGSPSVFPRSGEICSMGSSFYSAGDVILEPGSYFVLVKLVSSYVTFSGYWEMVCQPVQLDTSVYNINSRPTTITGGNIGIVGDNGELTVINNNQEIIDETNNIYYNPTTGQTYTITDWTYNYDNRIYNITLDTGDTVNVEYGDENITITENTINEGDTIVNNYTIYYIIDGGGSSTDPTPPPTVCPHAWAETSRTGPTCTAPGKVVSTCSQCGETKAETLKALGHDWKVLRTVPTEYDGNGAQIQAGYTLYECARCKEQYKDTDSTGPPGGDTNDGGLAGFLDGIIKTLSDKLSGAVDLILRFFTEIPALFDGFTAFLAAVFPFLPDEIMLLLTFGMAALVFVGIIKAIRR